MTISCCISSSIPQRVTLPMQPPSVGPGLLQPACHSTTSSSFDSSSSCATQLAWMLRTYRELRELICHLVYTSHDGDPEPLGWLVLPRVLLSTNEKLRSAVRSLAAVCQRNAIRILTRINGPYSPSWGARMNAAFVLKLDKDTNTASDQNVIVLTRLLAYVIRRLCHISQISVKLSSCETPYP